jgi:microcystin-dependent protein
MPAHNHALGATNQGADTAVAAGSALAELNNAYRGASGALTTLAPSSVTSAGGSQPHGNMMPYRVLNMVIALQGIFPSRN